MNSFTRRFLSGSTALAVCATIGATASVSSANAAPDRGDRNEASAHRADNLPNPFARRQTRQRKQAIELLVTGKAEKSPAPGGGSTVTTANGAVEFFDNDKQANVWTVLSEFGDEASGRYGRGTGPLHNQIAEPNEATDNSTQWTADFSQAHFEKMFNGEGESFRNYYLAQSNGQYTATGTVEDWVRVPKNGSWYGDNANETQGYWTYIADTVNAWYADEIAAGKSATEIDAYLAQFDQWDRYDFNGDGDFNEPDGYIDHFQAIHAGAGEEAGGGVLGDDAIWSHRWYADYTTEGSAGPTLADGTTNLLGGKQIGQSRFFVGDYTVEPENGGLGVFAHEYGHDLGLPDFYDTNGGENGSAFWTLMSSGSWLTHGTEASGFETGIGSTPNNMGPEERLFLGWLNHQTAAQASTGSYTINASGSAGPTQGVVVPLDDSTRSKNYTTPSSGTHAWHSGSASNLRNTLTRDVPAAGRVTVATQAWYDTEAGYDYWYAEYSTDNGTSWKRIGQPLDGESRGWQGMRFAYDAQGAPSQFRFRYSSDGGVNDAGVFLDDIVIKDGRTTLFSDDVEQGDNGWTPDGWSQSNGTTTTTAARYYILENRSYVGPYEDTLRTGPYNFGWLTSRPDWVQHFSYQNGMLVWLVDHGVADNNTTQHPGSAYALPIDANPTPLLWSDGSVARSRIQVFDAAFGTESTEALALQREVGGVTQTVTSPSRPGVAVFDDRRDYYDEALPGTSVETAGAGVTATVTEQTPATITVTVVNPAARTTP